MSHGHAPFVSLRVTLVREKVTRHKALIDAASTPNRSGLSISQKQAFPEFNFYHHEMRSDIPLLQAERALSSPSSEEALRHGRLDHLSPFL
jgi:hypothetical protein